MAIIMACVTIFILRKIAIISGFYCQFLISFLKCRHFFFFFDMHLTAAWKAANMIQITTSVMNIIVDFDYKRKTLILIRNQIISQLGLIVHNEYILQNKFWFSTNQN